MPPRFFKLLLVLRSVDRFGWYDVHHNNVFSGTVLAFSPVHAIDQVGKHDAYRRDAKGAAIGMNPAWKATYQYAPMSPQVAERTPSFRLSRSHVGAPA